MTRQTANELLMLRAAGPQAAQLIAFEQVMTQSRQLRAEAASELFAGVGRTFKRLAAGVARARTRRRVIDQLHRLDDRMLRDIGLERTTLTEAVDATLERRAPSWAVESFSITGLGKAIVRPIVRWHRSAVTLGELEQLDDHLLHDIGVNRGDLRYAPASVMQRAEAANQNAGLQAA